MKWKGRKEPSKTYELIEHAYKKHVPMVRSRALSVLRDARLADDIVQDVFLKYVEHRRKGRSEEETAGYLFQITTNLCLNVFRKRYTRKETLEAHPPEVTPAAQTSHDLDRRLLLDQILAQVSTSEAELAIYYFVDGMDQHEIADLLQVDRRTVGRRLDKFRAIARKILEHQQPERKEEL